MTSNSWRAALLCVFAANLFLAACAATPAVTDAPCDVSARIAEQAARFDIPGIAVAAIRNGRVAWIETLGTAGDAGTVDRDTLFNVASLTKPMFATMIMHLADDGRFSLDAPLATHWIDPDVADDPRHERLTARLALSHQTGFPNWRGRDALAFDFEPGARHEYSGEGYEYVRHAVERATGQAMSALMKTHVTDPAGMTDTFFGWDEAATGRLATGYRQDGGALDMAYVRNRDSSAAASTFTTIRDVAEFAAWVARGAGLATDTFAEMRRAQAVNDDPAEFFSIGWRITTVNGSPVMSHDGREGGLRTLMIVDPERRDGLVILTNSSNGELAMRGIIAAALPGGDAFNAQTDRDIWHFLSAQPPEMQTGLLGFISRSPSFSAKLLYAVDEALIASAGLPADERAAAARAVERVVLAHHSGQLDADAMIAQFTRLDTDDGDGVALSAGFDTAQARDWFSGLEILIGSQ